MKKFMSLIITAAMLLCALPAFAEPIGTCGDNLTWTLSDGVLTISGTGDMADYSAWDCAPWNASASLITSVVIEDGVTSIGSYAFTSCAGLASVTIPGSVTSINYNAFESCTALSDVEIPEGVTSIGGYAFSGCTSLESVTIPKSVVSVGGKAFLRTPYYDGSNTLYIGDVLIYCDAYSNVTSYEVKEGTRVIADEAFYYNTRAVSVTIPDSVTHIGKNAFSNCTKLASVTIPDSVTSVGQTAFYYCKALTSIAVPDSVTQMGMSVFAGCTSLESVTVPGSVTALPNKAFYGCTALKSAVLESGVATIGYQAFCGCTALESITLPDTLTEIGYNAFYNCSALTGVYITDLDSWCAVDIGYNSNPLTYAHNLHLNGSPVTDVTLPVGINTVGTAFSGCTSLESVMIPDGVTTIGCDAFSGCTSLTSVAIPDSVTSVEENAFQGCTALKNITLPDSIASVGTGAFNETAFYNDESNWDANSILYIGSVLVSGQGACDDVAIKDGTRVIADYAFSACADIKSVTIPGGITSLIGTFYGCTSLESVTIPDSVTNISEGAFYDTALYNDENNWENGVLYIGTVLIDANSDAVGDIEIKNGTKIISDWAFCYNESITSVTIPETVTNIGTGAFSGCTAVTDVYYGGTEEEWSKIAIDEYNEPILEATIHCAEAPSEPEIKSVSAAVNGTELSVTVSLSGASGAKALAVGFGADGEYIDSSEITDGEAILPSANVKTVKVFLWESLESMVPLCEAKEATLE